MIKIVVSSLCLASLASVLLISAPATAAQISGGAIVRQNDPVLGSGADSDGGTSHGEPISGGAAFQANTASFDIAPGFGVATMHGQSSLGVPFPNESHAEVLIQLSDVLHITGPITNTVQGSVTVGFHGTLIPAEGVEQAIFDTFGTDTQTTGAKASGIVRNATSGSSSQVDHNFVGSQHGLTNPCTPNPCTVGHEIDDTLTFAFEATDAARDITLDFTFGANGRYGGTFEFLAGAAPQRALAASNANSFFDIVVDLPEGLSFKADSGAFISQAVVPEPQTWLQLALGVALAGIFYRRSRTASL